jgi:hypothetical protein
VLFSKAVDHGIIAGIMVNVLILKAVYRGFIGGVMVNLRSTAFERGTLIRSDEPTIYCFRDKNANHYATDEPTIYRFRDKNVNPPPACLSRERYNVGSLVA